MEGNWENFEGIVEEDNSDFIIDWNCDELIIVFEFVCSNTVEELIIDIWLVEISDVAATFFIDVDDIKVVAIVIGVDEDNFELSSISSLMIISSVV